MILRRYDAAVTRVCAELPFGRTSPAKLVPGYRFDSEWVPPATLNQPARKVWHWPVQSVTVVLRTFEQVETDDETIARALERAREINAARLATMERARNLARKLDDAMLREVLSLLPRSSAGDTLRAHQFRGMRNALLAGGSRGFFHQTGTGKTITAASLLGLLVLPHDGLRVGVVVCPVTLIGAAWVKDLVDWFPDLPFVSLREHAKGTAREVAVASCVRARGRCVALVNYEAVRTDRSVRRIMAGAYVVLDESSKVKQYDAAVTETMREVAATFRGCVLLSGTPAPNDESEYWPQAKILAPASGYDAFPGSRSAFLTEFCKAKRFDLRSDACVGCGAPKWRHDRGEGCGSFQGKGHFGGHEFRHEQSARLHERLAPICEWVRKSDCLDLPPKSYVEVPVALDHKTAAAYAEMRDLMRVDLRRRYADGEALRAHAQNALVQVLRLRQITAGFVPASGELWVEGEEKILVPLGREKVDWLVEHAQADGEQVVLWTQFIFEAARYVKELKKADVACESITGETAEKERPEVFRRFVAGDFQVLVAHPGVAQYGVSLPGVSQAAYGSLSYSLQEYAQSQDRIHGIGRGDAAKRSTFYRLVATANGSATIDQALVDVLDGKKDALELIFAIDEQRRGEGFVPKDLGARIGA